MAKSSGNGLLYTDATTQLRRLRKRYNTDCTLLASKKIARIHFEQIPITYAKTDP